MLIESTLAGPRGDYGWVVPLPTRPSFVKAVKPEYIARAFSQRKPQITTLRENDPIPRLLVAGVLSAFVLTAGLRYRKLDIAWRIPLYAFESALAIGIVYWLGMKPVPDFMSVERTAFGDALSATAKAVHVESFGTVGSYEVNLVSSSSGSELFDWFETHHIQVPATSKEALKGYIKDGWVFLTANFRKNEDRPLPPHPLKAVFATNKVIYPMRLTGTQEVPLRLELLVISDKKAEIEGMKTWVCADDPLTIAVNRDPSLDHRIFNDWHDNLYDMAKGGMITTYLRGDFKPSEMQKDFEVKWKPYERFIATLHTKEQADIHFRSLIAAWMPFGASLFGLVSLIWTKKPGLTVSFGVVSTVLFAVGYAYSWYTSVEVIEGPQFQSAIYGNYPVY